MTRYGAETQQNTNIREFKVKTFSQLSEGVPVSHFADKTLEGNPCSIIRVTAGDRVSGLAFDGDKNNIMHIKPLNEGEYWLYVAPGDHNTIKVLAEDHLPANISLGQLEAYFSYYLELGSSKCRTLPRPVVIQSTPPDAEKIIDGISYDTNSRLELTDGEHDLILRREGFADLKTRIRITADDTFFHDLIMQELDPCPVKIYSEPEEASVFIKDKYYGKTNCGLFLFPGEHQITLKKSGYLDYHKTLLVKENEAKEFRIDMESSSAAVEVIVRQDNVQIRIDNEEFEPGEKICLNPGIYSLSVKKEGYRVYSQKLEILGHEDTTVRVDLSPLTGKFQFTVKPLDAVCRLKQNGNCVRQWVGMTLIKDLPVGTYVLECSAAGHEEHSEMICIQTDKTLSKNIQLLENAELLNNMVHVKAGTYVRGNTWGDHAEECNQIPAHKVTLTRSFYMSKYVVTRGDYYALMKPGRIIKMLKSGRRKNYPVESINWYKAVAYCNKLSQKHGLLPCYSVNGDTDPASWTIGKIICDFDANGYRLPTEAEWEYAARGGHCSKIEHIYSGSDAVGDVAWTEDNRLHAVGENCPNELGIFDMSGNIQEWCWDSYGEYSKEDQTDPAGSGGRHYRITRGGSWMNKAENASVFHRDYCSPFYGHRIIGFRIVSTHI